MTFIEYYALHVSRDFCNKFVCYLLVKTSICENRFSSLMGFQHLYSIIKCTIKYNLSYALVNCKHTSNPVNIPLTSISLNMSMLVIKIGQINKYEPNNKPQRRRHDQHYPPLLRSGTDCWVLGQTAGSSIVVLLAQRPVSQQWNHLESLVGLIISKLPSHIIRSSLWVENKHQFKSGHSKANTTQLFLRDLSCLTCLFWDNYANCIKTIIRNIMKECFLS